jgi:pSer/pThr/pTyr-binding forkhead associated (FHA) protein
LDEKPRAAYSQVQAEPDYAPEIPVQRVQVPLSVQYGPTLRSFKELPVTFGKNLACDFVLDHPAILDRHAQVFFGQDQYLVKDLTGKKMLSINGRPTDLQAVLSPGDILGFSPQGPKFRFLGNGRLAEVEQPVPERPAEVSHEKDKGAKAAKGIFKKFLGR